MREILFRGKRADNGEWVYGNLIQNKDGTFIVEKMEYSHIEYCNECDRPFDILYEVIPETVGQYTGLTDKNRKKIFEGDIVKDRDGFIHEVKIGEYLPIEFYRLLEQGIEENRIPHIYGVHCISADTKNTFVIPPKNAVEVIGNIHDNPELFGKEPPEAESEE